MFELPASMMLELKNGTMPSAAVRKKLCKLAKKHRAALKKQWEEIHDD